MLEDYVVIDLEMTGLNAKKDAILETGAVRVRNGKAEERYTALLNAGRMLSEELTALTGITQEMTSEGREPEDAMPEFFDFIGEDVLVGQNIIFDYGFLKQWAVNHGFPFERKAVDTLKLSRIFLPVDQKKDLESLCGYFGIERRNAHRALDDAIETWQIFEELKRRYSDKSKAFVPRELVYKAKKQTPATERQKQYLRCYAQRLDITVPAELDRMTRSEASRLLDNWIAQYGKLPAEPEIRQP